VVGDIHGCYSSWIKLKDKIEKQDSEAKFILVGDIVDRGPEVCKMIAWAMQNITLDGKFQMILGNHEDMKIKWWNDYKYQVKELLAEKEKRYGDKIKLTVDYRDFNRDAYGFADEMNNAGYGDDEVEEIINFFRSLPYYKELKVDMGKRKQHYIIVHGGISSECINKDETFRKRSIKEYGTETQTHTARSNKENILWERRYIGRSYLNRTIIIHGHTPTISRECELYTAVPGKIFFTANDINIDCGEVFRSLGYKAGNLAAIRLEDLEEFYVHNEEDEKHYYEDRNRRRKEDLVFPKKKRIASDDGSFGIEEY